MLVRNSAGFRSQLARAKDRQAQRALHLNSSAVVENGSDRGSSAVLKLDTDTGEPVWEARIAYVGTAGGDRPAYDADTGRQVWKFDPWSVSARPDDLCVLLFVPDSWGLRRYSEHRAR